MEIVKAIIKKATLTLADAIAVLDAMFARAGKGELTSASALERACLTFLRFGVDSFNGYIADKKHGRSNVRVAVLLWMSQFKADVEMAMLESASVRTFYITSGKTGLHGGDCERFTLSIGGETVNVLRHLGEASCDSGNWIREDLLTNLEVLDETSIVEKAAKGDDIRSFVVQVPDIGERIVSGALIGSMNDKRQLVIHAHKEKGVHATSIHTGKRGEKERCNAAVEAGKLEASEVGAIRADLFQGLVARRIKGDARNLEAGKRKAARLAAKAS